MDYSISSVAANQQRKAHAIAGWMAIGLSTLFTCLWAYWGVAENFYEGWYYHKLGQNLLLMFNYLMWMLVFWGLSLVSVRWSRSGGVLYGLAGIGAVIYYAARPISIVIAIPLILIGLLYWFGHIGSYKWAYRVVIGLPLIIILLAGVEPVFRILGRMNDGSLEVRLIQGNEVTLIWAPAGPGWSQGASNWETAMQTCRQLTENGQETSQISKEIWRLPTVDEIARSLTRHGENVHGEWTTGNNQITYQTMLDKESPLWDSYSPVIYRWTSTEIDSQTAYMVSFSGLVLPRSKKAFPDYYGFRCVKDP